MDENPENIVARSPQDSASRRQRVHYAIATLGGWALFAVTLSLFFWPGIDPRYSLIPSGAAMVMVGGNMLLARADGCPAGCAFLANFFWTLIYGGLTLLLAIGA